MNTTLGGRLDATRLVVIVVAVVVVVVAAEVESICDILLDPPTVVVSLNPELPSDTAKIIDTARMTPKERIIQIL
jgi:flavin reductase (DIM6/NTAB) family NADH-FMN oxidoreductase RutF